MYKVTQDHIDKGITNSGIGCPIALCLRESFNDKICVYSGSLSCEELSNSFIKYTRVRSYPFSNDLRNWIERFDKGLKVSEITLIFTGEEFYIMDEEQHEFANNWTSSVKKRRKSK